MSTFPLLRALLALPLLAGAVGAQADTATRAAPSAVVARPAGVVRRPAADSVARAAPREREVVSDVDPVLGTLAGIALGAVAGAMFDDACYGGGDGLALRGGIAAAAVTIPLYFVTRHERDPEREARDARRRDRTPKLLVLAGGAAAAGIALGAPVGAFEGARRPDACGGGAGQGALRTAGHVAAGTAAVGLVGMAFEALGNMNR